VSVDRTGYGLLTLFNGLTVFRSRVVLSASTGYRRRPRPASRSGITIRQTNCPRVKHSRERPWSSRAVL